MNVPERWRCLSGLEFRGERQLLLIYRLHLILLLVLLVLRVTAACFRLPSRGMEGGGRLRGFWFKDTKGSPCSHSAATAVAKVCRLASAQSRACRCTRTPSAWSAHHEALSLVPSAATKVLDSECLGSVLPITAWLPVGDMALEVVERYTWSVNGVSYLCAVLPPVANVVAPRRVS